MKSQDRESWLDGLSASTWTGARLSVLLIVVVVMMESGVFGAAIGYPLSLLLAVLGVIWALRGPDTLRRLAELYLWLAFIATIYYLQVISDALAGWTGVPAIDLLRMIAVICVLLAAGALQVLGAWSSARIAGAFAQPAGYAAGLLVMGAVVFWVGARTFPGIALDKVAANPDGHLWTSVNFVIATVVTLAGLLLFTLTLWERGERIFSVLGLAGFTFGAVFWVLHLVYRITVVTRAAEEWQRTAAVPPWYEPWREWAGLLFGAYSVLAYLGLAAYGGALLKTGWLPRWLGWTCVAAGLLALPLGGLPLFIHIPLWIAGIVLLRQERPRTEVA